MSNVAKNILAVDKEQELLQSFIRIGVTADDDSLENSPRTNSRRRDRDRGISSQRLIAGAHHVPRRSMSSAYALTTARSSGGRSGGGRKTVKFADEAEKNAAVNTNGRSNRIEAELRAARKKMEEQALKKKPKENFVDFYTDKDRAAAVSAGTYDIKQSLQLKQKQDRNEAMQIPEEADINSIIALGLKEIKNANPENAVHFFTQALELHGTDINALVSRSKCYLLLGEASKALEDAETALAEDKNNIRAIYQKAEALYFLGQFEQSLMFFHRGVRARPELASFRLGVQKAQEAIENTIGKGSANRITTTTAAAVPIKNKQKNKLDGKKTQKGDRQPKLSQAEMERRNARKLLGELCVDKEYLENLLKHPDLVRADTNTENISTYAKEAVDFLRKRQEFWRQQRACTALPNYKNAPLEALPAWF